ncbi:MAG: hypothetical protein WDZ51_13510 [Pirellulaceae bacterium]
MSIPSTLRTFVTLVCVGQLVVTPANAQGCELWNWLTGRSTTAAITPPPSVSFAPQVTTNYPAQQTMFYQPAVTQPQVQTVNFMPQTVYRTEMRSVPVTVYRPVPVYQGNQPGPPTMSYQGCTTNRFQVQRNPYLTHHAVVPATATCPTACGQTGYTAPATGNPGYYTAPATGGQEQWVPRDQGQQYQGQQSMIQGSTPPPAQFSPQGQQFQGQQPQTQQATPWQPVDPGAGQSSTYGQGQSTYGQQPSTAPSGGSQYSGEPADQRPTLNRPEMYDNQNGGGSAQSGQYITPSQQEAAAPTDWQPHPASEDDYQSSQRSNPQVNATPATITPPVTMPQSRGQQPSATRSSSGLSPVVPIPDPQFAPQGPTDEAPSLLDPRDKTVSSTSPRATIPVAWNEPQPRPFTQTRPEQTATRQSPSSRNNVQTVSQRPTEPKPAFDDSGWTSVRGK